ncbi:transposase IS116/IS110/IS902 family protein [Acetivibrio thermocellus ATCC 27405]|jgi:transposase|uniref:Transposase IS116/IS110/IS902 family protein n=1 Tax=Acetivibrio thermocellus (strain ATCC 27405 / DSM 1237 / JCM 9322 / NBRC 103400 / NCIMB 10682 / NRRL B-4536 / VPI 7372) TaxID=203119 RepID=A3DFP8_ACET2|nr:IS110-like element ISCth8 family transposase [Acetivibrio thermocellus]ABN52777.1 transposase IS116/IS110/IS902 family protein [Acetivibrio thermocellus ATCC 27405]ABN53969.1 transposase IS116/IS110/IS902 family protein [Acetivibrio thermocellus ATCC 27405]
MNFRPIAGIDVGKFFSEMAILSPSNEVIARMKIRHDSSTDVERAVELLKKTEKDFDSRPFVVMESTGHYHKILFHSLYKAGFEVSVINPIQTDSIKNIGIRKVKNDKVDARKIALLYRFQELKTTNIPDEDIECLRSLCRQYYKLSDELTAYKNRLMGIVDQLMLNFKDVFPNIFSKAALAVLEKYPAPAHILKANRNKLIALIQKNSRRSLKWATAKYELLNSKAKEFAPLSISNSSNVAMLGVYISMIKTLEENLEKVLKAIRSLIIEDMAKDMPMLALTLELLQSIPGIGLISAVTILAEIGDFSAFSKPGKLVAYFGIDPSVMQSGEFTGTQNKMSKRGSRLLRRVLFTIALANIRTKRDKTACNPVLMEYYKNKCQSKPKKVALGAVMRKLVNYIFAVLRDRKPYELRSPQEHAQMLAAKHTAA